MFEAEMDDITLLRDSIDTISELIDEAELVVTDKGLEIKAADRAVVSIVDFFLSKNVFKEFKVEGETKAGLNLTKFLQILKRVKPNEKVNFKLEDNKLNIIIKGDSTRKFKMPLIDVSKDEAPDMNKLEAGFSSTLTINADILNSGIEDAELITDSVIFTIQNDMFSIKAENDSSSAYLEIPNNSNGLKIEGATEPIRARYSLDYLKKIIKARKLSENVKIRMSTDYPMKIEFEDPEKLRLSFILAPRVEEQ